MIYDVHTHPFFIQEVSQDSEEVKARRNQFGLYKIAIQSLELFQRQMKTAEIDKAVLLPLDVRTRTKHPTISNEQINQLVNLAPDIFIGFASIDPHCKDADKLLDHDLRTYKLKGIKLNPTTQGFKPNDKDLIYPIYEVAVKHNVPILMHSGMTWEPFGLTEHSYPLLIEQAVQDFPSLRFGLAHFAWPWMAEACILAVKYENVFIDTSLLYFDCPNEFFEHVFSKHISASWIERSIPTKVLFGSNYPRIEQKRMKTALESIGLSRTALQKIYHENPERFIG